MVYVRIEIWPHGDRSAARHAKSPGIWKRGRVVDFPRQTLGPWDLLLRALVATVGNRNLLPGTPAIPVVLHCPRCALQHIDRGEWAVRPHRTHLCEGCGLEWLASAVPTVGVERIDEPEVQAHG